jgi:alpha-L-fucosidase 2
MKMSKGSGLKEAKGENLNAFYYVEKIEKPIISEKARITSPTLKSTFLYDLPTRAGEVITFVAYQP